MIVGVAVGEVRPGYEVWHPNREKPEVVATRVVVALLMAVTAAIAGVVTIAGFSLLGGGSAMGIVCMIFALLYALFAYLVAARWSRGILPVAASLSTILAIFCAVGADSWFARDKAGFDEGLIPSSAVGLLVIVMLLVQIVLAVACFYGFSQDWHVEEERPIGSGEDYGAGAPPSSDAPQPA